jgi:hypothetical protein
LLAAGQHSAKPSTDSVKARCYDRSSIESD